MVTDRLNSQTSMINMGQLSEEESTIPLKLSVSLCRLHTFPASFDKGHQQEMKDSSFNTN